MGEPDRDSGSGRYWKIRTTFEFVKLGVWVIWQCLRHDGPTSPL
jgi:hypothetical protein